MKDLRDFETSSGYQGLRHWRIIQSLTHEGRSPDVFRQTGEDTLDVVSGIERNPELKLALLEDSPVVITPSRDAPSPAAVNAWCKRKLAERKAVTRELITQNKGQGHVAERAGDRAPKESEGKVRDYGQQPESTEDKTEETEMRRVHVSKGSFDAGIVLQEIRPKETRVIRDEKGCRTTATSAKNWHSRTEMSGTQPPRVEAVDGGKQEAVIVSESPSPTELTSPHSLFSPMEVEGEFTFTNGPEAVVHAQEQSIAETKSTRAENLPRGQAKTPATSSERMLDIGSVASSPSETDGNKQETPKFLLPKSTGKLVRSRSAPVRSPQWDHSDVRPSVAKEQPLSPTQDAPQHSTPVSSRYSPQ